MDLDLLDKVVMEALRFEQTVRDGELHRRLMESFPDCEITRMWGGAWDYPPVERSLMRLKGRGLVTARLTFNGRWVDWKAVDPLDALSKL